MFVSEEAAILHADLDAFFASVEQRDRPELLGKPVIVGGGVVMAASYEARRKGVRSAMGGGQARRLCPDAIVVEPRFDAYVEASKAVFELFEDAAPHVEGLSIDEAFLDVRGLGHISGSPREIAERLRRRVAGEVGLPITIGVARTKFLAKIASGAAKPDGLQVVEPGTELAFLSPLPIEALWGVGPATGAKLREEGIETIGQIADTAVAQMVSILGPAAGRHLHALANNVDPRPVRARRGRRSIGSQSALGRSNPSPEKADVVLLGLVDRVARRMRKAGLAGRTVTLRLRFRDYTRATRSQTLAEATSATATLLEVSRMLLRSAFPAIECKGLTLIGITIGGLGSAGAIQLSLPLEGRSGSALDLALDEVRDRFGTKAIRRAVLHEKGPRFQPWLMPGEEPEME
jgi:DNA polymerase-4